MAMLVGVVVGTYSSIYIASPIVLAMDNYLEASPAQADAVEQALKAQRPLALERLCLALMGAPCAGAKTCAQLEQPHPSGGVPDLPPADADEDRSCHDRFSAHRSLWTASSACGDGREQRTQRDVASGASHRQR